MAADQTTTRQQATDEPADPGTSPTALREIIPGDLLQRSPERPFDPAPGLSVRRDGPPVQPLELGNGARAWLVTGFDEARAVLADPRFSSDRVRYPDATIQTAEQVAERAGRPLEPTTTDPRPDGMFIFMDPPEHTTLRRLLTGQFTVRRMNALQDRITEIAVESIEAMRAGGRSADLVPAYALPLPSLVICELLGVDYADRESFQHNSSTMLSSRSTPEERAAAGGALYQFISSLVAAKREQPGDDIISGLIHDPAHEVTDAQLIDISLVLLGAGHKTTANMLALGTFALLENPDQLAAVRDDPALLDQTVEELLRLLSIIQLGVTRVATEDLPVGDVTVLAGSTVVIASPEANRDARRWADPDRLDVHRPQAAHLAFGHGVHQCLGQQLARIEMRVGFGELLARLPGLRLAVPAEDVPLRNDMLVFGVHSLPVAWD